MNSSTQKPSKLPLIFTVLLVALLSVMAGIVINKNYLSSSRDTQTPSGLEATVLPKARPILGFELKH